MFRFALAIFFGGFFTFLFSFRGEILQIYENFRDRNFVTEIASNEVLKTKNAEILSFEEILNRGKKLRADGFLAAAAEKFSEAIKIEPRNRTAQISLVETQFALGDFQTTIELCENALKIFPADEDFLFFAARAFLHRGQFSSAKKTFEKIKNRETNFYFAIIAIVENDFVAAKNFLKIARQNPEFKTRAKIILRAFDEFSLFKSDDENYLKLLLAKSFNEIAAFDFAINLAKQVLQKNEKYIDAFLILGNAYLETEKTILAKNAFETALKLDKSKSETLFSLARCFEKLENFDRAAEFAKKAIAENFEPRAAAEKKLAQIYLKNQKIDAAIEIYEKILNAERDKIENYSQLVFVLLEYKNDAVRALRIATTARDNFLNSAAAQNLFGWAKLENGDLHAAKKAILRALKLDPNLAAAHLNLGKILKVQNLPNDALKSFFTAAKLGKNTEIEKLANEEIAEIQNEV